MNETLTNKKSAGEILNEIIAVAYDNMTSTKQQAFWVLVSTKSEEITLAIEHARQDGYDLGFGDGRTKGYDHGYHDGVTDRPVEEA